ncbi:TetR family transcriptional regulator [Nocardia tenerifensis]|uniref:TetR family transcriptional regulator n=1 Tax=Nocardia tenerifensis TaxID=228006 RepID=A0A318KEZ4_9NOCA|nr:TetR/AcrR family transcriptional regulator [Nocardia tenerifensis]PXX58117.1 TetR family transcriptional regulator [Nocardia tenerifensis]
MTTPRRGPGRPRKADAGDTKAALLDAALQLFARNGFAGTSIRSIAREVGLSESVLYAHFASKQAIFDAVLNTLGPRNPLDMIGDDVLADTDPPRYLRELVRVVLEEWEREDARLLISVMARDGLLHSSALRDAVSAMRTPVSRLFARWIEAGLIPANLAAPDDLAMSFTGFIGLTRVLHLHADASDRDREKARDDIRRHVETFISVVFRPD